ncbi:hypothetical protein ACWD1Z_36665 [Streptomyces sp. NPDC002784]
MLELLSGGEVLVLFGCGFFDAAVLWRSRRNVMAGCRRSTGVSYAEDAADRLAAALRARLA